MLWWDLEVLQCRIVNMIRLHTIPTPAVISMMVAFIGSTPLVILMIASYTRNTVRITSRLMFPSAPRISARA